MPLDILRCHIAWLIAVAVLTIGDSTALAANRVVSTFPSSGKPTKSGLMLQVDPNWVESDGFRPVRIAAKCMPPAIGDRTLTITLSTNTFGYRSESDAVSANLELPAGATTASIIIPVPQFAAWAQLLVAVAEDGQKIDDLSGILSVFSGYRQNVAEAALLHVTESPLGTDSDAFFGKLPQSAGTSAVQNGLPQPPGTPAAQDYLIGRALAEMPKEWIDLTALDFVVMSSDELALMAQTAPRAWQAVRDWTAAGGNLCIYDAGDRYERLADIDGYLGDRVPDAEGDSGPADNPWIDCDRSLLADLQQTVLNSMPGVDLSGDPQVPLPQIAAMLKDFVARYSAHDKLPFRSRAYRLGRVVALTSHNPFPTAADPAFAEMVNEWHWIRATLGTNRCSWPLRHGVSFEGGNPDFWNLLIPGVGLPPVNAYRVLITLFVILIGPVNYFALRRLRRLHFLLFIVPASAALVTAALLSYALICDGLGTRLRARSYTLLDQRCGQAVTWSRLSYYAGLAPYGGLTFPRDTAVFPFEYESGTSSNNNLQRTTAWDDEQHLARGWLPARTLTQFLAVRSGPEPKRLEIRPEKNSLRVANRLQTNVAQLVIADRSGRLYHLAELAEGQTVVVDPLPVDSPAGARPLIPAAFTAALTNRRVGETIEPPTPTSSLLGMNRQYYYSQPRLAISPGTSLLEQSLRQCDRTGVGPATGFLPGTYLAIVDGADPALLGVGSAQEEGSLHVIEGKW